MSFGTKSVVVEERKSLGIAYGILKLALKDFNLKTAASGKKQLEFLVEDDTPVGEDGYEYEGVLGKRKATNRSGRVGATIYFDINDAKVTDNVVKSFADIANKTGCREALDLVEASDFEDYLKKAFKVIGGKYVYFVVKAEEYISSTGKAGINRTLKSWGKDAALMIFAADSEVVKNGDIQTLTTKEGKTITWDKNNTYDYKPVVVPDKEVENALDIPGMSKNPGDDIPF